MDITRTHYISPHDCKDRHKGKNIWEMRRARLRLIAGALGLNMEGTKNEIIKRLIHKLDDMGAETEISEIGKRSEKTKAD